MRPESDHATALKSHALTHAIRFRARKRSRGAVRRCRARRARELMVLERGELSALILGIGIAATADEVETLRTQAVSLIRSGCAMCRLCERYRWGLP